MKLDKVTNWKGLLMFTFFIQLLFIGDCIGRKMGESKSSPKQPPKGGGGGGGDAGGVTPGDGVKVTSNSSQVTLDNGVVQVSFAIPEGYCVGIRFGGIDNILDATNGLSDRGYWSIAYDSKNDNDDSSEIGLPAKTYKIITQTPEKAEISFVYPRNETFPMQVEFRHVLLKGRSGFYSYGIYERIAGAPAMDVDQIRAVFKLKEMFSYMAITDKIQREMPVMQDRDSGQPLAYKEAVLLTKPVNPKFKGQVDDKYQYALEDKDNRLHGWVCSNPQVGIWIITPTDEFRMGGPHKQDLTSHCGPIMINMFHSTHYGGTDLTMKFAKGEAWKKVFGPFLVHLNSKGDPQALWKQAKEQMLTEIKSWPYDFPESADFPKADQRGSVEGRILVNDGGKAEPAKSGWVGLSPPGEAGSWQFQMKGYQFWVGIDPQGKFQIPNVRVGEYNLFAWVPGYIGDFKSAQVVNVVAGKNINLADQTFVPPRIGPTLWEIGIPDRSAAEFFVPDPNPTLTNPVFLNEPENKYRQYGLWDRYTDLYPKQDLSYTVGVSDFKKHWFFAHVLRLVGKKYEATTWQIGFPLKDVAAKSTYTLQIALAAASQAELQVRINNPDGKTRPTFTTKLIGKDNAIARHGIHGLYRLYNVSLPSTVLKSGDNTIYLTQSRNNEMFRGVLYDYIRLEGPGSPH